MNVRKVIVGPLETNCYILQIKDEIVIVDPGDDFSIIEKNLPKGKLVGCLVTHFHQDHIGALEEVISKYDLEINKVKSKNFNYTIIETPGHTFDSKTFYFKKEKIMFTGDFIFKNSIGRTDLGGNDQDMIKSLEMIKSYPDDIKIYPGHGEETNLGHEKNNFNIYY